VDAVTTSPIDLVRGEIAILKKLNHRNVVKLFEVLDDPSQVCQGQRSQTANFILAMQIGLFIYGF
jgi:hypothetical protein